MKNTHFLIILVLIFTAALGFAQESIEESDSSVSEGTEGEVAVVTSAEAPEIPDSILNNQYFRESVRLNELAKTAFEAGEYDISAAYAQQAAENARLSDEYVTMCLAEDVFLRAHNRYSWAGTVNADRRYPTQYRTATTAYNEAAEFRKAKEWEDTVVASDRVLIALLNVRGPNGETGPDGRVTYYVKSGSSTTPVVSGTLPAQYTVRTWKEYGDCFSAIAGRPWVYGDPSQWRVLFEANRKKLPNPNNPHLIEPGMIMDIPSLKGENRSGMWDPSAQY